MKQYLKFWHDLSRKDKQEIMKRHKIKAVTFQFIKSYYLEQLQINLKQ